MFMRRILSYMLVALAVAMLLAFEVRAQVAPFPPLPPIGTTQCQMVWIVVNGQGQWVAVCN